MPPRPTPRQLAHQGDQLLQQGKPQAALAAFTQAIQQIPDYSWALAHRGEAYAQLKQYDLAIADFTQALTHNPNYSWVLAHRGVAWRRLKQHPQALADLTQAIALAPNYVWAFVHRTELHIEMKQYEAALRDIDKIFALNGNKFERGWRGERGMVLNFLGRYEKTIAYCHPGVASDPDDFLTRYSFLVAYALHHGADSCQPLLQAGQAILTKQLETAVQVKTRAAISYRLAGLAALCRQDEQSFTHLQQAMVLHEEPREIIRHDPVWQQLRKTKRFQKLTNYALPSGAYTTELQTPINPVLTGTP